MKRSMIIKRKQNKLKLIFLYKSPFVYSAITFAAFSVLPVKVKYATNVLASTAVVIIALSIKIAVKNFFIFHSLFKLIQLFLFQRLSYQPSVQGVQPLHPADLPETL